MENEYCVVINKLKQTMEIYWKNKQFDDTSKSC